MAKSKSKNVKSNKKETVKRKSVDKKIDEMTSSTSNELLKLFRVLFAVIVVLGAFYLLTVAIVGSDKEEEVKETAIQYEEILAGSSFNMKDSEYVVVYYDFSDTELSELVSQIYSYSYTGEYRLYTVDMSNGFNKPYITGEDSDKSPNSAEDLLIKGPTLIKFKDGKVEKYVEGFDEVLEYLGKDK